MRKKFPANQIGRLPKPTAAQTKAVKDNFKAGVRCDICGGWHHPKVVHLDYVGHAALTDRMLDADPNWGWEPVAFTPEGVPAFDPNGGLWIKLTICGVTRLGYGNAAPSNFKEIGSREKEVIGDALRNAAMRFGAALDLWHKGDLHIDEPEEKPEPPKRPEWNKKLGECKTLEDYQAVKSEFISLNGNNLWDSYTGHKTKKTETWKQLFGTHLDRINKKPPVEANQTPEDVQKQFDSMVDTADSWATYSFCVDMMEKNPKLETDQNHDKIISLESDLVERLGAR